MKLVTIKEIALKSGVSLATVSRVINNSRPVQSDIRDKVMNVAKELGYVPNTAARALVKRRTDAIGVIVNNLHDPFFHDLIRGFEDGAVETDYNVVFCSTMGKEATEKQRYVHYLSNGVVDGIILYGSYDFDEQIVRELINQNFPLFLIESTIEGVNTNTFLIDNINGVYDAVCYLHRHGHQRIAYIAGKQHKKVCVDRLHGYQLAMKALRLEVPENYIEFIQESNKDAVVIMERLMALPKEQRPTAVLCYDDDVASYAIRSAYKLGLDIPGDVSVMGFDNQTIPPDGYKGPAITSVSQPLYEIGFDSIKLLSEYLQNDCKNNVIKTYATAIAEKDTVAYYKGEGKNELHE